MIKKYPSLFIMILLAAFAKMYGQDAPVLTLSIPYHNNLKYNRFLLNPAFSFVREDNTYVSLYHRNQWVQFDDSPSVYMLAYTGRFSDKAGLGIGIYQQTLGVLTSFGGIANYAYNVKLKEKMNLTLGFNLAYYNSGIDKNRTITENPDPLLMAMRNNSLLSIKPGVNLSYKGFDFGVYAENFVDYDFKSNKMATNYADKTYSAHVMYTHQMSTLKDLFEGSEFTLAFRGKTSQEWGFGMNGSVLVNFPRFGWLQTAIDDYYGVAAGIGFHFTKRLSLGYTFERTTKEGLVNLGPTHEITMVFAINDRAAAKQKFAEEKEVLPVKDSIAADEKAVEEILLKEDASEKTEPEFDKNAELEKLKLELDENSLYLLDVLKKEDSVVKTKKAEFDKKVKNLMEYAQREKEAKKLKEANEPLVLQNLTPPNKTIVPETLEDLKSAEEGYYVISRDIDSKEGDKKVNIEKHTSFPEAVKASEKKKASGKEKEVYVVHVDNSPFEQETKTSNKPKIINHDELLQNPSAITTATKETEKKNDNIKMEQEIKEFYSDKTAKPRETIRKVNKLAVEGMDPGFYIIANVFSGHENTMKFIKNMEDRGVKVHYFINPKNGFRYVYLKKHSTWREALISYYSNVNNSYFDPIWIMSINTN